jgi:hypothetical protein
MSDHLKKYEFQKGMEKVPGSGRQKGTRNRLTESFLKDLHSEWQRSGPAVLKVLAIEDPASFAKLAQGLVPKEFVAETPSMLVISTGVPRAINGIVPAAAPQLPAAAPESVPLAREDDFQTD